MTRLGLFLLAVSVAAFGPSVSPADTQRSYALSDLGVYGVALEPYDEGDTVTGTLNEGLIGFFDNVAGAPVGLSGGTAGSHYVKSYELKYQGEIFAAESNRSPGSSHPRVPFRFSSTCVDHGQDVVFEARATWVFVLASGNVEIEMPTTEFRLRTHNRVLWWGEGYNMFGNPVTDFAEAGALLGASLLDRLGPSHDHLPATVAEGLAQTQVQIYPQVTEATVIMAFCHGLPHRVEDSVTNPIMFTAFYQYPHETPGIEFAGIDYHVREKPADGSKRFSVVAYYACRTLDEGSSAVSAHFPLPVPPNSAYLGFVKSVHLRCWPKDKWAIWLADIGAGRDPSVSLREDGVYLTLHADHVLDELARGSTVKEAVSSANNEYVCIEYVSRLDHHLNPLIVQGDGECRLHFVYLTPSERAVLGLTRSRRHIVRIPVEEHY